MFSIFRKNLFLLFVLVTVVSTSIPYGTIFAQEEEEFFDPYRSNTEYIIVDHNPTQTTRNEVHHKQTDAGLVQNKTETNITEVMQKNKPLTFGCDLSKLTGSLDGSFFGSCLAVAGYYLFMKPAFWVAGKMSLLFNFVLFKLVVGMGGIVNSIDGVDVAWRVLRDLANVFLVFLLIYIGIATILGISGYGYKQLLWKVVVAALFVNFSITFAKIVIDVSNIVSVEAYSLFINSANGSNGLSTEQCLSAQGTFGEAPREDNGCITNGIAGAFWSAMSITSMFDMDDANGNSNSTTDGDWTIFFATILGGLFLIVLSFLFGAATFLIITRFVILVYLIIVSPVALVMWITNTSKSGRDWWETLINQSIFAPALIVSWWIAYLITDSLSSTVSGSLAEGSGFTVAAMSMTVLYIISAGFLLAGLVIAKKLGAHGATTIMNTGNKWSKAAMYGAAGAAGAYVGGGLSSYAARKHREASAQAYQKNADGTYMYNSLADRFNRTALGAKMNRGVQAAVAAPSKSKKFGGGTSYTERREAAKKAAEAQQKQFSTINRKTELKGAIESSAMSTAGMTDAGRAHVERAQQTMKDLKHTDIKEHADLFKENPERLAHVSSSTFKQVVENKDGTFTDADIQKFTKARLEQEEKTIKENPAKASDTYKKIIENKDGVYTQSQVEEYKEKSKKHFAEMAPDKVSEIINKSAPKDLAEQDSSFLGRYEVVRELDIPTLTGMIKSGLSKEKRDAIRNTLEKEYDNLTNPNVSSTLSEEEKKKVAKLYEWLTNDNRMAV